MSRGKKIIVITGVPGTGKTFLSNFLKKKIKNAEVIRVTEVINKKKLFSSYSKEGEKIVNMPGLRAELERMVKMSKATVVILESHILCDLKIRDAKAIVLREHLRLMLDRLRERGYAQKKINANILSEATDYCGIKAEKNYKEVFEMFGSDKSTVKDALRLVKGQKVRRRKIELLDEFVRLMKKNHNLLR